MICSLSDTKRERRPSHCDEIRLFRSSPRLARATAAEHPTMPPPAMTMSALSRVSELLILVEVTVEILGRVAASTRRDGPQRALIITELTITAEAKLNLLSFLQRKSLL